MFQQQKKIEFEIEIILQIMNLKLLGINIFKNYKTYTWKNYKIWPRKNKNLNSSMMIYCLGWNIQCSQDASLL